MRFLATISCATLALVTILSACGSASGASGHGTFAPRSATTRCHEGTGFALSLVSGRNGRPTPVAAAEWFAVHGGVSAIPHGGWRLIKRGGASATTRSGAVTLDVIRGPDKTWKVDSGYRCSQAH